MEKTNARFRGNSAPGRVNPELCGSGVHPWILADEGSPGRDEEDVDDDVAEALDKRPQQQKDGQRLSELEQQYDRNIRPVLDVVDKLRTLGIMSEGIQLPSIVVVGDQSSGKSSVLESLAGINLPRGQGIATRVPLVLRLQRCPPEEPATITIEYGEIREQISEDGIKSSVDMATIALAGDGKGVTYKPIAIHIRKPNAPDLTMIDLPGITRVPVHGQPENIYEQIAAMIHHYIKSKECVILNVLSATVDFSTCESIRMSQKEDKDGKRTLAVVTKVDRAPDGLFEKVTVDAVNIGLGYVCVRNRADEEESHDDARSREKELFDSHPTLSKLDKDTVGIPSLAEKLTHIQARIIRDSLPGIVNKIESVLKEKRRELQSLPEGVADELEAESVFLRIMMEKRMALERLIVQGNFKDFSDRNEMYYAARLDEFFRTFSDYVHSSGANLRTKEKSEEIVRLMTESRGVYLPNFLNGTVFQFLVRTQLGLITCACQQLVTKVHDYALRVVYAVIEQHAGAFANLKSSYIRSVDKVLARTRDQCLEFVNRELEKEGDMVHTMNDYYMANVRKLQEQVHLAKKRLSHPQTPQQMNSFTAHGIPSPGRSESIKQENLDRELLGFYTYKVENSTTENPASNDHQASLDMKVSLIAYWKVVHKRLTDAITLELRYAFQTAILKDLDADVLREKATKGVSYLVNEDAVMAKRRKRLKQSVHILQASYALVANHLF